MKRLTYSNDDVSALCSELSYLIHAGIAEGDALTLLSEDESRPAYKAVLQEMTRQADSGRQLSEIFAAQKCFPRHLSNMLAVGERTGRVEEALNALAADSGRKATMESRIKSSLLYPSILLLIMLAVIAVLLVYVLPIFNSVYAQLGGSMAGIAGGLLSFGRALGRVMPLLIALFCLAVLFLALFSAWPVFRDAILDRWQRKRGDKGVSGRMNAASFAQAMALAMNSGMDVEQAIEGSAQLISNREEARTKLDRCLEILRLGGGTAEALKEAGLIPAAQARILEAGIRGGSGELAMDQIADRLTFESEQAMEDAISRVEPTMVIITSLLVGLILISVMLPLINIMSAIG